MAVDLESGSETSSSLTTIITNNHHHEDYNIIRTQPPGVGGTLDEKHGNEDGSVSGGPASCALANNQDHSRSNTGSEFLVSPNTTTSDHMIDDCSRVQQQQQQQQREPLNKPCCSNNNCTPNTALVNPPPPPPSASATEGQDGPALSEATWDATKTPVQAEPTNTKNGTRASGSVKSPSINPKSSRDNIRIHTPQTKRTSPAVPSEFTRTMGSSLFPRPCQSHAPTLEELQSYSFSDYVREVVLRKALPKFEDAGDENDDFAEDEWIRKPMPLTEGIAKVTLPQGFWKEEGIGKDKTGRGPAWQKGQPLGDLVLEMPISQHVRGITGVYEYTFTEVPPISVADFRQRADEYRKSQVGAAVDDNEDGGGKDQNDDHDEPRSDKKDEPSCSSVNHHREENRLIQLDRHFWKRLGPTMPPAWYGADQEGTLFGDDPASGWSLGELDSCLHVLSRVPGVTTPYLYAGMWASVFCAHTEDMNLLSINFLHAGAPKIWYAIAPGPDAKRFEALCEFQYSVASRGCKEFMRHKRHLLSPMVLHKAGIKYTTAVQRPGDAIITFPGGYHFGFNTGFNMAEATNFGVPEWIPFGLQARVCLCRPDSVRIDMNKLIALLEMYESDRVRKRIRSWKEWSRLREAKKQQQKAKGKKNSESRRNAEALAVSTATTSAKKRKLLSEQEKKNEFWIEVVKPASVKPKLPQLKQRTKEVEEDGGRGKRQKKKTSRLAMWEEECKKEHEKPQKEKEEVTVWHLAKPIGRKGVEIDARVLCLLPGTVLSSANTDSSDGGRRVGLSEDEEEDQCFRGIVVERADNHVRVHLDGLSKSEDVWVQLGTPKLFLDGGQWVDGREECAIPQLHYWKEMDSKVLVGDEEE
ncbi:hypothetical protein ACA910_015841 [Epithemia clementina (nom. ined.)]